MTEELRAFQLDGPVDACTGAGMWALDTISGRPVARCLGQTDAEVLVALTARRAPELHGEVERTISGETYMGMPVAAYIADTEYGGEFATHWSTIPEHRNPERLFREKDVRAALRTLSAGKAEAEAERDEARNYVALMADSPMDWGSDPGLLAARILQAEVTRLTEALGKVREAILDPINVNGAVIDTVWMPMPNGMVPIETLIDFIDAARQPLPPSPVEIEEP
jgi:hypothetical protein